MPTWPCSSWRRALGDGGVGGLLHQAVAEPVGRGTAGAAPRRSARAAAARESAARQRGRIDQPLEQRQAEPAPGRRRRPPTTSRAAGSSRSSRACRTLLHERRDLQRVGVGELPAGRSSRAQRAALDQVAQRLARGRTGCRRRARRGAPRPSSDSARAGHGRRAARRPPRVERAQLDLAVAVRVALAGALAEPPGAVPRGRCGRAAPGRTASSSVSAEQRLDQVERRLVRPVQVLEHEAAAAARAASRQSSSADHRRRCGGCTRLAAELAQHLRRSRASGVQAEQRGQERVGARRSSPNTPCERGLQLEADARLGGRWRRAPSQSRSSSRTGQ